MSMKLESLAACAANLMALAREYPDVAELKVALGLVMEELRKEIQSVARKRAA